MSARGPYRGKRLVDLALVALLTIPAVILGGVCALAVVVGSGRPVLFHQERVGLRGQAFELLKFRTMRPPSEGTERSGFPDADQITGVGAWLRRTSLDELPQLINVARGEMSIVGPRPTLAYQVARYDDRQRGRLAVRPGLTGKAQLEGRNRLTWAERIELDLDYVTSQSVRVDLSLLLRTPAALLRGSGVEGHPRDDPLAAPDEPGS